jgi:nitroimidazol reductase NimA-like FMN-containing flavoprotein (pyridoxamine 5'-phosphate oxidase superfamily)
MLDEMKAMARAKNICVLATITGHKPYCSLMAYVTDPACTEVYMVTHRETQKYQNLMSNPAVSLMIDTRESSPRSKARAMTVEGHYEKIRDMLKLERIRRQLLAVHPHLKQFMSHPESEILRIKIKSFLLLDGLTQSSFVELS